MQQLVPIHKMNSFFLIFLSVLHVFLLSLSHLSASNLQRKLFLPLSSLMSYIAELTLPQFVAFIHCFFGFLGFFNLSFLITRTWTSASHHGAKCEASGFFVAVPLLSEGCPLHPGPCQGHFPGLCTPDLGTAHCWLGLWK